jgi:hypothetical protein
MLVDQDTEKVIVPLNNLKSTLGDAEKPGHLEVSIVEMCLCAMNSC